MFSRTGKYLLSGSDDGIVIVWKINHEPLSARPIGGPIQADSRKITGLAELPDGRILISGSDQALKIWDMDHLFDDQIDSPIQPGPLIAVLPLRDGQTVMSSDGNYIWRWDLSSRKSPLSIHSLGTYRDHSSVNSLIFSPDGLSAAAVSNDCIVLFDLSDLFNNPDSPRDTVQGTVQGTVLTPPGVVVYSNPALAISPDSTHLAACDESEVWLWEIGSKKFVHRLEVNFVRGSIRTLAVSPRGEMIAYSASKNFGIYVWDVKNNIDLNPPSESHVGLVNALAFSQSGEHIASASGDKTIRVWHSRTGKPIFQAMPGHDSYVRELAWSPDGRRIVSGTESGAVYLVDAQSGCMLGGPWRAQSRRITCVTFTHDGTQAISASADGTVRMWDTTPRPFSIAERIHVHDDWVQAVAISPDGRRVASGGHDFRIALYDKEMSGLVAWHAHEDWVHCIAFTPDGKSFVSGSADGRVRVWEGAAESSKYDLRTPHDVAVRSLAISSDGLSLCTGLESHRGQGFIHSWTLRSGKLVHSFVAHHDTVSAVVFSSDNTRIVSGSSDGTVCVWSTSTSVKLLGPFNCGQGQVLSLAYSPEGFFATAGGDGTVCTWHATTGSARSASFVGHNARVQAIAITADGSRIFSGSDDRSVRMWDPETGKQLGRPLYGHTDRVLAIAVASDGRQFVTGGVDGTVVVWNAELEGRDNAGIWEGGDAQGMVADGVTLEEDGWLQSYSGRQLCWVPPGLRAGLRLPRTGPAFGASEVILDVSKFVHGREWAKCNSK